MGTEYLIVHFQAISESELVVWLSAQGIRFYPGLSDTDVRPYLLEVFDFLQLDIGACWRTVDIAPSNPVTNLAYALTDKRQMDEAIVAVRSLGAFGWMMGAG